MRRHRQSGSKAGVVRCWFARGLTHPSGEVDDVGRLVLFEDGLGGLHVPQVTVLAAEEHVLLVLLGLI